MVGYLLDTNHVSALGAGNARIMQEINSLPPSTLVRVCTITLGEVEAGHQMTMTTNPQRRNEVIQVINARLLPLALPVSSSTRIYYAQIISRLWHQHPPPNHRTKTEKHLVSLGIDINDVWIVAVAWEHGLTLLTTDGMDKIRAVVSETEVKFGSWL